MTITAQTAPYKFQTGDYAGKAAVLVMWQNPEGVHYMWEQMRKHGNNGTKSAYFEYIEWLIRQGENRVTSYICPQCNMAPVTHFSLLESWGWDYSISVGLMHTCCNSQECQTALRESAPRNVELLPFKFSVFREIRKRRNLGRKQLVYYQREILMLFRGVFGFTAKVKLTERRADLFFKSLPSAA